MRVICIGAAVMDITARPVGQKEKWKEKQRISDIQIQTGGDAANQSVHLAALGWEPALVSCVGKDANGKLLRAALEKRGVDAGLIREKEEYSTGTAMVLVDEQGERHIFSVKGAHSTLSKSDLPEIRTLPSSCRAISLASIFSMPVLEADGLLEYLREARAKDILVFADLAADKQGLGFEGIQKFLPWIDYFLPSLYDVLEMTGTDRAEDAAEVFLESGVGCVAVKCGAAGSYLADWKTGFRGWIPVAEVETLDTTGAGDCMSAAFLARILAGEQPEEACRYACGAASYSTMFLGASQVELKDEKIREFLQR